MPVLVNIQDKSPRAPQKKKKNKNLELADVLHAGLTVTLQ